MAIQAIILAAGKGKRMHSSLPKVLHPLAGKPLLEHVLDTALAVAPATSPIVVYGHQGDKLRQAFDHYSVRWVEQKEQLGTGHAVQQTLSEITNADQVLILYADVPLISKDTLKALIAATPKDAIGMLTANLLSPNGYGRIKRDKNNQVIRVVEENDATHDERKITEINSGIYLIPVQFLKHWLPKLTNKNAQAEYYLTDIIALAESEKVAIHAVQPSIPEEILGINDRVQLSHLERVYQRHLAEKLMRQGVTIYDPARFDVRGEAVIGKDVTVDINVIFEGRVVIGDGCVIGPNSLLRNVELGNQVEIKANSIIDGAEIAAHAIIGPFARIRPGTVLAENVHVGNFVEIKNSKVGDKTKINHLSYVGDSEIGKCVNIGAGTITCNYDGVNKHKTTIGDNVFIGSNTQLIAPVSVGEGATIGAGSTITRDAPPQRLTLSRTPQRTVEDWERPQKK